MNHAAILANLLLARAARLSDLGSGFRGRRARPETSDVLVGLAIAAGVAAVVWLLWYVNLRQQGGGKRSRPLMLFFELCRAHGLRFSERWLLWRLARAARLRDPARLFLEPERFAAAELPAALRLRAGQLARLGQRLFPEPLDVPMDDDSQPKDETSPSSDLPSEAPSWPSGIGMGEMPSAGLGVPQG